MKIVRKIRNLDPSDKWDFENGFYWFHDKSRLNKALAQYELYKMIIDLPGDVYEFGVLKAASLIRFCNYRDLLENDFSRKVVGFDVFGQFPETPLTLDHDIDYKNRIQSEAGDGLSRKEVTDILVHKGFENYKLVEGDALDTLPKYIEQYPEERIALLHLDMGPKEVTEFVLGRLFHKVVPGGLVVFDNYSAIEGETIAADNLVMKHNLKIEKLSHYKMPSFVRKPC